MVKCNVWEEAVQRSIFSIRKIELKVLWRSFVLSAFNTFLMSSIPAIVSVATFYIYIIISDEDLTPRIAFTSLTLFAVLRVPLFQVRAPQSLLQSLSQCFNYPCFCFMCTATPSHHTALTSICVSSSLGRVLF